MEPNPWQRHLLTLVAKGRRPEDRDWWLKWMGMPDCRWFPDSDVLSASESGFIKIGEAVNKQTVAELIKIREPRIRSYPTCAAVIVPSDGGRDKRRCLQPAKPNGYCTYHQSYA